MQIDNWFLRCPKCKDDTNLQVDIHTFGLLTEGGIEVSEEAAKLSQLRDSTPCECLECGYKAVIRSFRA